MEECKVKKNNKQDYYLDNLVNEICATYDDKTGINHIEGFNLPAEEEILEIISALLEIVFPGFSSKKNYNLNTLKFNIGAITTNLFYQLSDQVERALKFNCKRENCDDCNYFEDAKKITKEVLSEISNIRAAMKLDVVAAYNGDPAAMSYDEIILSYPGIKAITIQRFAHVLYHHKIPLIPRMMTEFAHRITGIDIHPGAHLGEGVFIDHGTGVVIGETARIGNGVKIYQGVTLGALSFPKNACGVIIKGAKRHPTIEEEVTIYSGATILGDIVVGANSVIGGNVWLSESVDKGTKIMIEPPKQIVKNKKNKNLK